MAKEQFKTLTESMYYVLLALLNPQHGYGIMQLVDNVTGGKVKVGAGTLYNLLARFEEEKMIEQIKEEDRKKIYQITEKGLTILNQELQRLHNLIEDGNKMLENREDLK